jgi:hypothetical protein
MVGKLDEERTRFSFECAFQDLVKESRGRVNALIIFNAQKEAFFESLTVEMELPRREVIKVTESTTSLDETEKNLRQFNMPRKTFVEPQPKEKPKSKYHQY